MRSLDDVWAALRLVMDPEIPTISLVDLGVITDVALDEAENRVSVEMTPTFVGCPAMDYMRADVERRLSAMGFGHVDVHVTLDVPWDSNRISAEGRAALLQHGLAPPEEYEGVLRLEVLNNVQCPRCGSRDTTLSSPFGPTLCRSLHLCGSCGEGFESFKPV